MARGTVREYVSKTGKSSWQIYYWAPQPDGTRRKKWETHPTQREAEAALNRALAAIDAGTYLAPTRATVKDYLLTQWLPAIEPALRPASHLRYRQMVERHLAPGLGRIGLAKLTATQLQTFYATKLATGLSPTTVNNMHMVLHRAFDQAVKWRLIAHNPCTGAEPPRRARLSMTTWTADQSRVFLDGTASHAWAVLWRLALTTGLRKGELLALMWADLDLERGVLSVQRTLTRDKQERFVVGHPKTAAGRRAIALDAATVAGLRQHRAQQLARRRQWGDAWQDTGAVFDRGDGRLLHPNTLDQTYHRLATELGLPRIRFHDLRHTSATLALAAGVHPKIVSERLGHSSISMTLDRYSHVSLNMQQAAADTVADLLAGPGRTDGRTVAEA